jgi:hypothetical protein
VENSAFGRSAEAAVMTIGLQPAASIFVVFRLSWPLYNFIAPDFSHCGLRSMRSRAQRFGNAKLY